MRLRQAAPAAGALVDRGHLDGRHGLEIGERQLDRRGGTVAADLDLVGLDVDLRDVREVIADIKLVVRRDRCAQIFDRRFVVWRPVGELYERLLARQRPHRGVAADAVGHARRDFGDRRLGLGETRQSGKCKRSTCACCLQQVTSCDHGVLPRGSQKPFRPSPRL